MHTPRFYCQTLLAGLHTVALPAEVTHHVNVLRLESGRQIVLFDGSGGEYACQIRFEGKRVLADINGFTEREAELSGQITLVQGLAGGDKMDWIIEKAVELGVSTIAPVAARRSVLQLSGARLEKRMQHWQRIIQSASEQCGRNRLATLSAPAPLVGAMASTSSSPSHLTLLCDPSATTSLSGCLADHAPLKAVTLLVGPEGGWDQDEVQIALDKGAVAVNFGSRVLRTETAGLALITAVSTLCGWT
jgi:16S rRNA (uracil1498-N3)-methyltransferase